MTQNTCFAVICREVLFRQVADGFYVDSIRIEDKGPIVIWVIMGAQAGGTVVLSTGFKSCMIEGINFGA